MYDEKTTWQVYKTQFSIVAETNGWDSQAKACHLATSLTAHTVDILQTLPENKRLVFEALSSALKLNFGEKCLKDYMSGTSNELSINGHIDGIPCNMIIDTRANVTIIQKDLVQEFNDKLIWKPSKITLQTVSSEKIDKDGMLNISPLEVPPIITRQMWQILKILAYSDWTF
ncbi:hypothetical protein X975_14587, partial [Stegodyphus mimosarum]